MRHQHLAPIDGVIRAHELLIAAVRREGREILVAERDGALEVFDPAGQLHGRYWIPAGAQLFVMDGATCRVGDPLAEWSPSPPLAAALDAAASAAFDEDVAWRHAPDPPSLGLLERWLEAERVCDPAVLAVADGLIVADEPAAITVEHAAGLRRYLRRPAWSMPPLGARVVAGAALGQGERDHHELLAVLGRDAFADHLASELEAGFAAAGAPVAGAHVEVVVRALLDYVRVVDAGASDLPLGSLIAREAFVERVADAEANGRAPPSAEPALCGLTETALHRRIER
jgi:hypothetical protein